jgi:hypothetical protein
MSVLGTLGNFAFGTDDWKDAFHEASQGHWGEAAKSAGWGALALGSTAAMAVPVLGQGVKGAAMAAEAAHLATAGRAAEGVMGAARAARGAEAVASVSRPSVQAYAQGSGREFLADSFGIGRTGAGRTVSRAADQTAYGFPDSVAAGRSPVATLTRPGVKPVTPDGPMWQPGTPFRPTPPPGKPQPKFDPITPQRTTRKPPRQPDINPEKAPVEAPTLPETVVEGPGTTLMPKDKLITQEGATTQTQLKPKLGSDGRPLPIGVVVPAAATENPNGTPTKPGSKPKKPRKGPNDSIWLQVPGQDINQQVVY